MPYRYDAGRARKRSGAALASFLFLTSAAGTSWAAGTIEEVVVTAQRTEESLQEVPIAVTAFTGAMLEERQIITPSDLQLSTPNVSFTATNFGGSSFSIRGIGNLVIGASEGGVSFHTNEIPLSTNLVAAEFFDMERVEVLRGPQGTLYGRQATGGAINFVTAKPDLDAMSGHMDVEYGDYDHQRLKGAINLPVTETFGIRIAGMTLERDGYIENTAHNQVGNCLIAGTTLEQYNADPEGSTTPCTLSGIDDDVDGRDLYSYRATALWEPTDRLSGWIMFSKFHENDDRARITNQVCQTNDLPVNGCNPDGFGFDQPHLGATTGGLFAGLVGAGLVGERIGSRAFEAPRGGLREMHTDFEPEYYNDEDTWLGQVQYEFDDFTVVLQGGMQESQFFSQQDYLMDVGADLYATPANPTGYWPTSAPSGRYGAGYSNPRCNWNDGTAGVFGDCNMPVDTTRVFAFDQSDSEFENWTVEARVQSSFDGPLNFVAGVSQGNFKSSGGNYYVIANTLDLAGLYGVPRLGFPPLYPTMFDSVGDPGTSGELDSTSVFGEAYYQLTDTIKITAGLRYNDDTRETSSSGILYNSIDTTVFGVHPDMFTPGAVAPEFYWTRASDLLFGGGSTPLLELYVPADQLAAAVATGALSPERFAAAELVPLVPGFNETRTLTGSPDEVDFQETTGRIGLDWQFSDSSMVYGFFTRGYKPGGFNPPINPEFQATSSFSFESEQVDAFEIGSKNMLFEDTLMLNGSVFYYDYGDLQVSRIVNNSSLNDNIDAEIYGLEIEGLWRPEEVPGLSIDFNFAYLKAEAAGGATSIDPMDRTGGNPDFIPLKNIDSGSNTAVAFVARRSDITQAHIDEAFSICRALSSNNPFNATTPTQATGCPLTAAGTDYPDGLPTYFSKSYLQGVGNTVGAVEVSDGFETDIDGNSLPASPENTFKVGVAYDWQLEMGTVTPRLDYHWRGESYGREFNTKGDEIDSWDQINASVAFVTTDGTWQGMLWVRNLEDEDNVTGHYLTSDTSGFFRNYFLTEPRIWGASIRYNFGGVQ